MKILGFCFFLFLNLNLFAQKDSGYVAHQYYMEYEAFKDVGRYEMAQRALYQAIKYKDLYYLQYSTMPQLLEINALVKNELSDSQRYENRIEWAQIALDSADIKTWSRAEKHAKSSFIAIAKRHYEDAQNILSKPTVLISEIEERILTIPIDTIYNFNPFLKELLYVKSAEPPSYQRKFLPFIIDGDTIYNKRDSTLYNGVYISGPNIQNIKTRRPAYHGESYERTFATINNGFIEKETRQSFMLAMAYDTLNKLYYVLHESSIYIDNNSSIFRFNHLGDTTHYEYYELNGEDYLKLNAKKIPLSTSINT